MFCTVPSASTSCPEFSFALISAIVVSVLSGRLASAITLFELPSWISEVPVMFMFCVVTVEPLTFVTLPNGISWDSCCLLEVKRSSVTPCEAL